MRQHAEKTERERRLSPAVVLVASIVGPLAATPANADGFATAHVIGSACSSAFAEASDLVQDEGRSAHGTSLDGVADEPPPCNAEQSDGVDAAEAYLLGCMLAEGTHCVRDDAQAAKWYLIAANQGLTAAQLAIGQLYLEERGVQQDFEQAIHWFGIAHDSGHAPAKEFRLSAYDQLLRTDPEGCIAANDVPFLHAVIHDSREVIHNYLAMGLDVDRLRNASGTTALMIAVNGGVPDLVQLLLEHGADPDVQEKHGNTALHIAAADDKPELSAILLRYGADATIAESVGYTPLQVSLLSGAIKNVRFLIGAGVDPEYSGAIGIPPIYLAARENHVDAAKALLDSGADIDASWEGSTALQAAVAQGNHELVSLLVDRCANVGVRTPSGSSVRAIAAGNADFEMMRILNRRSCELEFPARR